MNKRPKKRGNPNHHIKPLPAARVEELLYGAPLPDIHTQERLEEKRKGTLIMPSLQDALQSAMQKQTNQVLHATINEWAQDEQPQTKPEEKAVTNTTPVFNVTRVAPGKIRFTPTVGVSEATFRYVKDNPGKTRREIIDALDAKGFKESSTSSLVGQFTRMDYFLKDANGGLRVAFNDYRPLPSTKAQIRYFQAKEAAKNPRARAKTTTLVAKKPKASKAEGIAALQPATTEKALALPLPVNKFEPGALIDSLSVMQARELYDMLKRIFGG